MSVLYRTMLLAQLLSIGFVLCSNLGLKTAQHSFTVTLGHEVQDQRLIQLAASLDKKQLEPSHVSKH